MAARFRSSEGHVEEINVPGGHLPCTIEKMAGPNADRLKKGLSHFERILPITPQSDSKIRPNSAQMLVVGIFTQHIVDPDS